MEQSGPGDQFGEYLIEAEAGRGLLFIAMRYVEGVDLRGLLKQTGRLEPRRAARLIAQAAGALDASHARGMVHRDVKPGNILGEVQRSSPVWMIYAGTPHSSGLSVQPAAKAWF